MKRQLASVALLTFLVAACDNKPTAEAPARPPAATAPVAAPSPDPAVAGFQHDPALDVFGYYFAQPPAQVGNWRLKSLNMGSPSDFAAWEDGKRPSNFGPFFLEFQDVTSPTAENELGQTYHTVSFRLLADSYRVDTREVAFRSADPRIGEVAFLGQFDVDALKAAKAGGPGGEARAVLTGGLRIGAEPVRKISFVYFAGD
ncbi:hypothetical protein CSW58_04910 [Caulobacter sp. B11]|uniref:hypothetical protein n=1 Tax=Caulobacter sp. B11 TaxID=2048899 RepID=UPI000C12A42C|nr:hypothetical protein [Caulobacter sp. B11]PHY13550.1 hypothetical protein CSW58_04910 [Caulobacter sp. B11]